MDLLPSRYRITQHGMAQTLLGWLEIGGVNIRTFLMFTQNAPGSEDVKHGFCHVFLYRFHNRSIGLLLLLFEIQ